MADDFNITPPPLYPPLIGGAARDAQFAPASASVNFDDDLRASEGALAAHQESLRMWRVLAVRGHQGAAEVVAHHGLRAPACACVVGTNASTG